MFDLPLHPFAAHLVVGFCAALMILAPLVLAGWVRGVWPRRVWWLVVALQLVLVAAALVGVRSGELVEGDARELLAFEQVDHHERLGKRLAIVAGATQLLIFAAALVSDERLGRRLAGGAVAACAVQAVAAGFAGHAGGTLVWGQDGLLDRTAEAPHLSEGRLVDD